MTLGIRYAGVEASPGRVILVCEEGAPYLQTILVATVTGLSSRRQGFQRGPILFAYGRS